MSGRRLRQLMHLNQDYGLRYPILDPKRVASAPEDPAHIDKIFQYVI